MSIEIERIEKKKLWKRDDIGENWVITLKIYDNEDIFIVILICA